MTIFALVDPRTKRQWLAKHDDLSDALRDVGLKSGQVDFATIWSSRDRSLSIVAYEFGLLEPPDTQSYFALGGALYVGGCVLFATDNAGETIDASMSDVPPITWFQNARAVEMAIARGEVQRPVIAVNGEVLWSWPQAGGREAGRQAARRMVMQQLSERDDDEGPFIVVIE